MVLQGLLLCTEAIVLYNAGGATLQNMGNKSCEYINDCAFCNSTSLSYFVNEWFVWNFVNVRNNDLANKCAMAYAW